MNPRRTLTLLAALLFLPAGILGMTDSARAVHGNAIIMVLDNDETVGNGLAARTSLVNSGFQECAAVAASAHAWNCFQVVQPSAYCNTLLQSGRRVLYVGESPSLLALGALYNCRNRLASWTASGGCVVALNENNQGDVWDWTPRSVFNQYPLWTNVAGNDVTKTTAGNAHIATAGVTLNGWSQSYHQYFHQKASFMTTLAYRGGNVNHAVILTWTHGAGGVLAIGLDADTHNNMGNADARRFVRQSVEWALDCSCDQPASPTHTWGAVEAEAPLVADLAHELGIDPVGLSDRVTGGFTLPDVQVELGGAYVTPDGAVFLESNSEPGLQRSRDDGDPTPTDTRIA